MWNRLELEGVVVFSPNEQKPWSSEHGDRDSLGFVQVKGEKWGNSFTPTEQGQRGS
jgi:hypothetical protein